MEENITIVGLDVHKNSIEIVTVETAGSWHSCSVMDCLRILTFGSRTQGSSPLWEIGVSVTPIYESTILIQSALGNIFLRFSSYREFFFSRRLSTYIIKSNIVSDGTRERLPSVKKRKKSNQWTVSISGFENLPRQS